MIRLHQFRIDLPRQALVQGSQPIRAGWVDIQARHKYQLEEISPKTNFHERHKERRHKMRHQHRRTLDITLGKAKDPCYTFSPVFDCAQEPSGK